MLGTTPTHPAGPLTGHDPPITLNDLSFDVNKTWDETWAPLSKKAPPPPHHPPPADRGVGRGRDRGVGRGRDRGVERGRGRGVGRGRDRGVGRGRDRVVGRAHGAVGHVTFL